MTIQAENQIKDFKNYLVQLGYSEGSCGMLPRCVKSFFVWTAKMDSSAFSSVDVDGFYEWLQSRPNQKKEGGLSEQYISHHIYSLKVFFSWLEESQQISYNPMSVMKFRKPTGNPREPLLQEEIQSLFTVARTLREQAILHLFYSCGLRNSEGVALNTRDIHFKQRILYVREGKGNKRRAVPMSRRVSEELEHYYLKERISQHSVKDSEAFILNRVSGRMKSLAYNRLLKDLLQRANIKKEVSLHHLRHSIATHLLERGLGIESVRDFLGHAHLESTQVYAKVSSFQLSKL